MTHTSALASDLGISGCQISPCMVTLPSLSPFAILLFTTSSILVFNLSCLALASSGIESHHLFSPFSTCMPNVSSPVYTLTIHQLCYWSHAGPPWTAIPCLDLCLHCYALVPNSSCVINNCQPAHSNTFAHPQISGCVVSSLFPFHLYFQTHTWTLHLQYTSTGTSRIRT